MEQLSAHPEASIPEACGTPKATKGAYRLLCNPAVTPQRIWQPHFEQTARRAAEFDTVLAIQDTTEIDLTSHEATKGVGYLASPHCRGLLAHSVLCVTPEGSPLGLLNQLVWARPFESIGKRRDCNQKPVAEKESQRWLDGLAAVERNLPNHPRVVLIGDRESDLYDLFARQRRPGVELLVRIYHRRRRVDHPARYLDQALAETPVGGYVNMEVPRADDRPTRTARMAVRWCNLLIYPPANYRGVSPATPVRLSFVQATEANCPAGQTPLEWLLGTTLCVESLEQAMQGLEWYSRRWMIERFHYVLKSGCGVERRALATVERMERLLTVYSLIAWELLRLTHEARRTPEASCEPVLKRVQWQVLHLATQTRTPLPTRAPTLSQAIRALAQLGGFLGRRHDGQPGVKTLWRGWRRLTDLVTGYNLARGP